MQSLQARLDRCDREIAEIHSREDWYTAPNWLLTLGLMDWETEKHLIEQQNKAFDREALFSSTSDSWATPQALLVGLNTEFGLTFDPCPLDGTENGLATLFTDWEGRRVFCNPPYGRGVGEWLRRGLEAEIAVFLLPARTDTRWFHEIVIPNAKQVRFIKGRLKFGKELHPAPFPSMVVIFRR